MADDQEPADIMLAAEQAYIEAGGTDPKGRISAMLDALDHEGFNLLVPRPTRAEQRRRLIQRNKELENFKL